MAIRSTARPGFQDVFLPNFPSLVEELTFENEKMVFKDTKKPLLQYLQEDMNLQPERASHFEGMRFWLSDKEFTLFALKYQYVPVDEQEA